MRNKNGDGGMWVRPISIWKNPIEIDGKTVKQFEYIGELREENNEGRLIKYD